MRALLLWSVAVALRGDAVDQLLTLPAPLRDWKVAIHYVEPPQSSAGPAADASLDKIAEYWAQSSWRRETPSSEIAERLVEAIDARPELLAALVDVLPVREDVIQRVRKAAASLAEPDEHMERWLLFHDPAQRSRLIEAARGAKDAEGPYVDGGDVLDALAKADWNAAAPLLTMFMNSRQPHVQAQALALTFGHARGVERDALRNTLRTIVADAAAPAGARNTALNALLADDWPGRDLWLVSLLRDPTFFFAQEQSNGYAFASQVAASDPDRWIPIMTRLIGSENRVVRSAAVNALAQFHLERTRLDALRPILCWISDPGWADDNLGNRLRLVQTVAKAGLQEAIPGLVWVVEHDSDSSRATYAAEALGDFHDARGNAAMRRALATTKDAFDAQLLVKALLVTGGFTSDEIAAGLIETARNSDRDTPIIRFELKGSIPEKIGAGVTFPFAQQDDGVGQALIARHEARPKDRIIRKALFETDTPSTARFLATHLRDDDAEVLTAAIAHADSLRTHASQELRRAAAGEGVAAAVATILLGDSKAMATRLEHGTTDERRGLLAAARARREPLDIRAVAGLFGLTPPLDRAVEAYLAAIDTPPARAAIYARYPGQAHILGGAWEMFPDWETAWRARILAGEADEVIGLISAGGFSAQKIHAEIALHAGSVQVKVDGKDVQVSDAAIAELRAFLRNSDFDNLPPLMTEVYDGLQYEYVHLTRSGGARVFMNNPGVTDFGTPYTEVVRRLRALEPAR